MPFFIALALVFVAEMGDKSQLLVLAFAARYPLRVVVPAVLLATLLIHFFSASVGHLAGSVLPMFWTQLGAGVAFILFGLWTLRPEREHADGQGEGLQWGPFLMIAGTFFLSELGDKTMLVSIAVAGQQRSFLAVWLGGTLGMFLADSIALVAGRFLGTKLQPKWIRYGSAAVFMITGVVVLVHLAAGL